MSNISIKLNLAGLKHVVRKEKRKDGTLVECLIIPIDQNHLYRGEKGMYIDLTAIEIKNIREGSKDTHLVKQNLPKTIYNSLSEEERKALPILGNAIYWAQASSNSNVSAVVEQAEEDDLPF